MGGTREVDKMENLSLDGQSASHWPSSCWGFQIMRIGKYDVYPYSKQGAVVLF